MGKYNSIKHVALLTQEMKKDDSKKVLDFFRKNKNEFEKEDLINIVDELLHGICEYKVKQILEDVGCEIDEKYDELYQKEQNRNKLKPRLYLCKYQVGYKDNKPVYNWGAYDSKGTLLLSTVKKDECMQKVRDAGYVPYPMNTVLFRKINS